MATVNDLSKGLVLWTKGDTAAFKVKSDTNAIIISSIDDPPVELLTITPEKGTDTDIIATPKLYDAYFNSEVKLEKYSGKELVVTDSDTNQTISSTYALMVVPQGNNTLKITAATGKVNTELVITTATSMKFKNSASNITIENGGLLVLGGCSVKLSSNGLKINPEGDDGKMYIDEDCHYAQTSGISNTNCGIGTLVIESGYTLRIDSGSTLHIGSYKYGDGVLSVQQDFNLIRSNLNIGASNIVENTNGVIVSGSTDITVSGSTVNVGGGHGSNDFNNNVAVGGEGHLTISSNISNSKIFIGSGAGSGERGTIDNDGGASGGDGTLTVSSDINNSIIFLGGAGGGATMMSSDYAGVGGSGILNISPGITDGGINNSIVFVGSSGGGAKYDNNVYSVGGGFASKNGGLGTLTISDSVNQISHKIISFGLPAASGADITQNIKTGAISDSVVFVGCGNYGTDSKQGNDAYSFGGSSGGGCGFYDAGGGGAGGIGIGEWSNNGASVALDYENHGYISQRMIMSFRGMTPGILTLPNGTQFPYIGEFPRADCSSWATTGETGVSLDDFIPPLVDKRTSNKTYNSPSCFLEPVTGFSSSNPSFNAIIINPKGAKVSSQFGSNITTSNKQLGISEQSILYQSDTVNDKSGGDPPSGPHQNDAKKFIAIFNGTPEDGTKSYYQTFDLSNLRVSGSTGLSESNPAKITVKKQCTLSIGGSGNDCYITAPGNTLTLDGSGDKVFAKATFANTIIENEKTTSIVNADNIIDCSNLYVKDLNHQLNINNACIFASGSEISRESGAEGTNSFVNLSNTSLGSSGKIVLGDVKGTSSGQNITKISKSTINSTISIDTDASQSNQASYATINKVIVNTPLKTSLKASDIITHLTFSKGSFSSNADATVGDDDLTNTFAITEGDTPITLSEAVVKSGSTVNYGTTAFGISKATIQGQYDVDMRNRLSMTSGVTLPANSTLTVNGTLTAKSQTTIGKNGLLAISNTSVDGLIIGDDVNFELNGPYNFASVFKANDLVTYLGSGATNASTQTSATFLQGKVFINALKYLNDSSLTYDPNMAFETSQLNLFDASEHPLQIEISNNRIKNNSSHALIISKAFSINGLIVTPSEINTLIINSNSSIKFSMISDLTLSEAIAITGNQIFFDESTITTSGDYSQFNLKSDSGQTTFLGFDLENNAKKLIVKGSLKINQKTFLKLGSNVTIPEGTTLIFDIPKAADGTTLQDSYFVLKGQPKFIGTNTITLHSSSPGTEQNPITFDFDKPIQRAIEVVDGITFVNSNITFIDSVNNSGEAEFVNSSGSFKDFTNTQIFRMSYSKITSNKTLQIVNNGISAWYNSEVTPLNNGILTILNGSSMCPSMSDANILIKRTLEFSKNLTVGTLNIAPKGSLTIYTQAMNTVFKGSLQINNDVFLGSDSQISPAISSNNASTALIMNTSKYDFFHPLLGQIFMDAQTGCSATLQINSSGRITMPSSGIFKVTGYKEAQKVVVNGTFKSSVENGVYEYQKDMTLNGTIEMEHSAIIRGNLQITSSGHLMIGNVVAAGGIPCGNDVQIAEEAVKSSDGVTTIGMKYILTFPADSSYATTIITEITEGEASTTASYKGTGISPLRNVERIFDGGNTTYTWEYSNGLKATFVINSKPSKTLTFEAFSDISLGNVFFGDSSDVYISDALNIFGTFYNNGKLTVNARLLLSATASVINDGEIAVKGDNDNTIIGTVEIGNLGHLIFNGTYRDHRAHRLVINERGTLTVNDSLTVASKTKEMIISALTDPQKCNVLINGDIKTSPLIVSYDIAPKRDDKRESVYISINVSSDLDKYGPQ